MAALSCTDCSGSSTASSDITDPGSPFSTASSHSDDSSAASQPPKMPPTQSAHHPPWPWVAAESPHTKRPSPEKTAPAKRIRTAIEDSMESEENRLEEKRLEENVTKQPPARLSSSSSSSSVSLSKFVALEVPTSPAPSEFGNSNKAPSSNLVSSVKAKKAAARKSEMFKGQQQGKITEYFKSQIKANCTSIKKDFALAASKTTNAIRNNLNMHKYFATAAVTAKTTQIVLPRTKADARTLSTLRKTIGDSNTNTRVKKVSPVTIPRKILPAPSKVCDNGLNNLSSFGPTAAFTPTAPTFAPTVTLAPAVTFALPPNLAYLQAKAAKPPDNYILQPFISSDKLNGIPIVNTSCINTMIQPTTIQKITTINNFNCIKLNATVVPIVKLNTLPSKVNGSNFGTSVPSTAVCPPKVSECGLQANLPPHRQENQSVVADTPTSPIKTRVETDSTVVIKNSSRIESESVVKSSSRVESSVSPPDSDSGISSSHLEVCVSESATVVKEEPQKSPILSQPKTIRFPAKERSSSECKDSSQQSLHSTDSCLCQWEDCHSQFDTSGALLEHLQVSPTFTNLILCAGNKDKTS